MKMNLRHNKRWMRFRGVSGRLQTDEDDEEDEEEETPIHLKQPSIDPYDTITSTKPFMDFIVRPKAPLNAYTALSGPVVLPPIAGQAPNFPTPRATLGYEVFKKKYTELQIAGLLDGSGIWVQDVIEEEEVEDYLNPQL